MKKIIALLLAVAMMAALFAGCSNSDTTTTTGSDSSNTTTSSDTDTTAADTTSTDEIVTLTWYQVGGGEPGNLAAWTENINAYLEEKIGVHLDLQIVSWGDWDSRRNMIISTNENYDIMFTNNGTYLSDVQMGAFLDISDLVQTVTPDLYDFIPEAYWEACEIDGALYAVPAYKDSSLTNYFIYDKDLVEDTGLDYENVHDFQSVTEIVAAMYELYGSAVTIQSQDGTDTLGNLYDGLGLGLPVVGVSYYDTDGTPTVVNVFEQADALANLATLHEWATAGYTNSDAAILSEAPSYRPFYVAQGWSLAAETTWGPNMGGSEYTGEETTTAVAIQIGDTVVSNDTVQGSMSCISAACQYPEKALQLLELVNTDSYVRDSLYYGLEGDQWDYVEVDGETRVHLNEDTRSCEWTGAGYTQGTFFIVTQLDTATVNQWDEVAELNENAVASPCLGCVIDTTDFYDELSACQAIWSNYKPQIWTGIGDPDTLIPQMLAEMENEGLSTIIEQTQAQVDAWYAAVNG